MKTGNRSQATILAIVAVGAIGFLVIQLLPGKVGPSLGSAGANTSQAVAATIPAELPLAMVGDPFSHPKLAVKPVVSDAQPVPKRDISGYLPVNPLIGGLPNAILGSNPAESAGNSRQKPQGPQITLVAVMDAGTPVAMLQIDGKEAKTFKAGEKLAKDTWLILVGHSFVKVQIGEDIHRIENGETYGADDGDKK